MPTQEKPQTGYTGVNMRVDKANMATDQQVPVAINVDFNKELGTASIRNGSYAFAEDFDAVVRLIAKVNTNRYYVHGQAVRRNSTALGIHPEKLDARLQTDIEGMRPLNDLAVWAFIADVGDRDKIDSPITTFSTDDAGQVTRAGTFTGRGHSAMKKDDGTRLYKWGIGEPAAAPEVGLPNTWSTDTDRTYIWNFTYVRFDSTNEDNPEAVAHEGNPVSVTKVDVSVPG